MEIIDTLPMYLADILIISNPIFLNHHSFDQYLIILDLFLVLNIACVMKDFWMLNLLVVVALHIFRSFLYGYSAKFILNKNHKFNSSFFLQALLIIKPTIFLKMLLSFFDLFTSNMFLSLFKLFHQISTGLSLFLCLLLQSLYALLLILFALWITPFFFLILLLQKKLIEMKGLRCKCLSIFIFTYLMVVSFPSLILVIIAHFKYIYLYLTLDTFLYFSLLFLFPLIFPFNITFLFLQIFSLICLFNLFFR